MKTKTLIRRLYSEIYVLSIADTCTVFIPTTQRVKKAYHNGEVGDQLWEQMVNGTLTSNMWTKKEIQALANIAGRRELMEGKIIPVEYEIEVPDDHDCEL